MERNAEQARLLGRSSGRAAGEPVRAGEEILEDELRGERGNGEIETLETRRRYAEDHAQRSGHDTGDRDADQRRHAMRGPEPGGGKRAEAEKCAVAQRYLAGEPDQHVEPERGDAVDADQDELAQNVIAGEQRQREQKRDAGTGHDHRSPGPEHGHVRGVAGAEVAAGPGIGNVGHGLVRVPSGLMRCRSDRSQFQRKFSGSLQRHIRSMFSVPNRP